MILSDTLRIPTFRSGTNPGRLELTCLLSARLRLCAAVFSITYFLHQRRTEATRSENNTFEETYSSNINKHVRQYPQHSVSEEIRKAGGWRPWLKGFMIFKGWIIPEDCRYLFATSLILSAVRTWVSLWQPEISGQYSLSMVQAIEKRDMSLMKGPGVRLGLMLLLGGAHGIPAWQDLAWSNFERSRDTHVLTRIHQFVMGNNAYFHDTMDSVQIIGAADLGIEVVKILDSIMKDMVPNLVQGIGSTYKMGSASGLSILMVVTLGIAFRRSIDAFTQHHALALDERLRDLEQKRDQMRVCAISSWRTAHTSGQVDREVEEYNECLKEIEAVESAAQRARIFSGLSIFVGRISFHAAQLLVVLLTIADGNPQAAASFAGYSTLLSDKINFFMDLPQTIWRRLYSTDRLRVMMQRESTRRYGKETLRVTTCRIELKDVAFTHASNRNGVMFRGLTLSFEPGQVTAVVGESGIGKSTILDLIMGLYDPQKGCIEIDGQDIRNLKKDEYV